MAMMFFVFLKIDVEKILEKIKTPLKIAYIILIMMIVLPIIIFFTTMALPTEFNIGFTLIGIMVPASSIVAMVSLFKGNVNLGLIIQVLYFLIFPFVMPVFFFILFGRVTQINIMSLFVSLATLIFLPLIFSQIFLYLKKNLAKRVAKHSNITSIIFLAILAVGAISDKAVFILQNPVFILSLMLGVLGIMVFFQVATYYLTFSFSKQERKTVSICKTLMNGTMTLVIANEFFSETVVLIALSLFIFWFAYPFIGKIIFRLMGTTKK